MNKKIKRTYYNFNYFCNKKTPLANYILVSKADLINSTMKHITGIFLAFFLCTQISFGQYAGAQVSAGIASISNENTSFTPEGTAHYGYHLGFDARLNEGLMFFNPGLHFYKFSLMSTENMDFFGHEYSMTIIKGRMNMGFVFDASRVFKPRFKIGGTLNYLTDVTDPNPLNTGLDELNSTVGLNAGIGADISVFTIDFDYERGMSNGIKDVEKSRFDYYTFSLGIFF
jgi:hypothetical protein